MRNILIILFLFIAHDSFGQSMTNNPQIFNVEVFGAKPDGKNIYDVVTTNTSATITSASANFTAADVGKTILVNGAGTSGAVLRTTIASFTNSTTVVLTVTASASLTADTTIYGTDNTASIQRAINACDAALGGTVYFPTGIYILSSAVGGTGNSQLNIPFDAATKNRKDILLKGQERSGGLPTPYAAGSSTPMVQSGVILYSTVTGSGNTPAVISSNSIANSANRTDLSLENITIKVFTNNGNTAISMNGVNGLGFQTNSGTKVTITPDVVLARTTSPVSNEVTAWITPPVSDNGENIFTGCIFTGFKYGLFTNEHTLLLGNSIYGCWAGIAFPAMFHPVVGYTQIFGCVHQLYSPTITIYGQSAGASNISLVIESEIDSASGVLPAGAWYKSIDNISDSSSQLTGDVRINNVNPGSGTAIGVFGASNTKFTYSLFQDQYILRTKNNTLSGTNTFSGSNTFSSTNTFSNSNTFSGTNSFTNSNTFGATNTFTGAQTIPTVQGSTSVSGDLTLTSTGNVTKHDIYLGSAHTSVYDEVNDRIGIGTITPNNQLEISSATNTKLRLNHTSSSGQAAITFAVNGTLNWQNGMDFASNGTADYYIYDQANTKVRFYINNQIVYIGATAQTSATTAAMNLTDAGLVGIGIVPTARIHIRAGTATASTAPLKFTAGTRLATPETGTIQFETGQFILTDNLTLATAGNKINIATGTNASVGVATLSGGTVTVSTTAVTASSLIYLTDATTGTLTNIGTPTVGTKTAGTSFVINSSNVLDTSTVNWIIIN